MTVEDELLEVLACPQCKEKVYYLAEEDALLCGECNLKYRVEDDIPIMLIDEAEEIEVAEMDQLLDKAER